MLSLCFDYLETHAVSVMRVIQTTETSMEGVQETHAAFLRSAQTPGVD